MDVVLKGKMKAVDLGGKPRIDRVFNQVDIGAYEYHPAGTLILVN